MIVGFLFGGELLLKRQLYVTDRQQALLSALGHYLLLRNLNGKFVETSYLTQSQVSAVSILLATIFKAALTAGMGICFAQHLRFLLRGNPMALTAVEKLFVIRTNLLALGDLQCFWRAPLLFLMAFLVWCLRLAAIYPPGALTVTLKAHTYTQHHSMPVMNPPVPKNLDLANNDTSPVLHSGGMYYIEYAQSIGKGRVHRAPREADGRSFQYG